MKYFLLLFFGFCLAASAQTEAELLQDCGKRNLESCNKLGAYYLSVSDWEKAYLVGEALCSQNEFEGCTYAGAALLAQKKIKEGTTFLYIPCGEFEPLGCRSLGRLMMKGKETELANMYFKRACFYGLKEICKDVKSTKSGYSKPGLELVESIQADCAGEETSPLCKSHLTTVKDCKPPLKSQDCQLLAGYLSIYFRAKFLQTEAKLSLLSLHMAQKKSPLPSYDYAQLSKEIKTTQSKYVLGFLRICSKRFVPGKKYVSNALELDPKVFGELGSRTVANIRAYFLSGKRSDCKEPKSGFEAFAVGNLDPQDPSRLDIWSIDEEKTVIQVRNGLPNP